MMKCIDNRAVGKQGLADEKWEEMTQLTTTAGSECRTINDNYDIIHNGPIHVNLNKTMFYVSQVNIFCLLSCTRTLMAY